MKGKRKVQTIKWLLKSQFENEARSVLARRSRMASNRFLDAVVHDIKHEPWASHHADDYTEADRDNR